MNSYQPKQVSNLQAYQQKPFLNHNELSPMMKSPINKQKNNLRFTYQDKPRQFVNTPVRVGVYDFQNKTDMKNFQKSSNQTPNHTPTKKGMNIQQGKKFTPLSYKEQPKVFLVEQDDKSKQYSKQTLQIVMVGFVILILIMGSFYSLILWDKMKNMENQNGNQLSITTNTTVLNNTVKIQPVSSKNEVNNNNQWKILPQDEQSPLGFLEHQKDQKPKNTYVHLRTMKIQPTHHYPQQNYLHRRKY